MLEFDHVIVAVADLDVASRMMQEQFGLAVVEGGRHQGHGTANRIVPLGPDYIELLAVVDPEEANGSPAGGAFAALMAADDRPARLIGWMARPDDMDRVVAHQGLDVVQAARTRPDGVVLEWEMAGVDRLFQRPALPVFIAWSSPPEHHPGRAAVRHDRDVTGIAWVEVGTDPAELHAAVGDWADVRCVPDGEGLVAVGLRTGSGDELVLRF